MNAFAAASGFAEISHHRSHALLRVPLHGGDMRLAAVLVAAYRRADPLVINLEVRTPEEITVFRRSVTRADFVQGLTAPIEHAGTRIAPADPRMVEVRFTDAAAVVALRIPAGAVRRFVRVTEQIVPVDEEGRVLGELAASLSSNPG